MAVAGNLKSYHKGNPRHLTGTCIVNWFGDYQESLQHNELAVINLSFFHFRRLVPCRVIGSYVWKETRKSSLFIFDAMISKTLARWLLDCLDALSDGECITLKCSHWNVFLVLSTQRPFICLNTSSWGCMNHIQSHSHRTILHIWRQLSTPGLKHLFLLRLNVPGSISQFFMSDSWSLHLFHSSDPNMFYSINKSADLLKAYHPELHRITPSNHIST